jgi:flagellar basal body P-ring protein FlgI
MAAAKKKIQASDVVVGSRTLESVLIDLAEQIKANDARFANRTERADELSTQANARSARAEELSAESNARANIALETIAAVTKDLRAITQELRESNQQHRERLGALEKAVAAE